MSDQKPLPDLSFSSTLLQTSTATSNPVDTTLHQYNTSINSGIASLPPKKRQSALKNIVWGNEKPEDFILKSKRKRKQCERYEDTRMLQTKPLKITKPKKLKSEKKTKSMSKKQNLDVNLKPDEKPEIPKDTRALNAIEPTKLSKVVNGKKNEKVQSVKKYVKTGKPTVNGGSTGVKKTSVSNLNGSKHQKVDPSLLTNASMGTDPFRRRKQCFKRQRDQLLSVLERIRNVGKREFFHRPISLCFTEETEVIQAQEKTKIEESQAILEDFSSKQSKPSKRMDERFLQEYEAVLAEHEQLLCSIQEKDFIRTEYTFNYFIERYKAGEYFSKMPTPILEEMEFVLHYLEDDSFDPNSEELFMVDFEKLHQEFTMWHTVSKNIFSTYIDHCGEGDKLLSQRNESNLLYVEVFFERIFYNLSTFRKKCLTELASVKFEEQIDVVDKENREPALKVWRKQAHPARTYVPLTEYEVVKGVSQKESGDILSKLQASDFTLTGTGPAEANTWILPEGTKDYNDFAIDQKFVNGKEKAPKRKGDNDEDNMDPWEACLLGEDVKERQTWGIDCWVRKNIILALETVTPESLRMTPAQKNWFVEGLLLRNIFLQHEAHAYDISVTLNQLAAEARQEQLSILDSIRVQNRRKHGGERQRRSRYSVVFCSSLFSS